MGARVRYVSHKQITEPEQRYFACPNIKKKTNYKKMYNLKRNNYHLKPKNSNIYTPPVEFHSEILIFNIKV